jgi:hypothetical protein
VITRRLPLGADAEFETVIRAASEFAKIVLVAGEADYAEVSIGFRLVALSDRIRTDGVRGGHTMCSCAADLIAFAALIAVGADIADEVNRAYVMCTPERTEQRWPPVSDPLSPTMNS